MGNVGTMKTDLKTQTPFRVFFTDVAARRGGRVFRSKMRRREPRWVDGAKCWKCAGCKEYLTEDLFGIDRGKWNGVSSRCRACDRKLTRGRRSRSPAEYRKMRAGVARRYRANNRDKVNEYARKRYADNREHILELTRNRDRAKTNAAAAAYRAANREAFAKRQEKYRAANPEKTAAHRAVREAIATGGVVRPRCCSTCLSEGRIEAHHWSYEQEHWLDVVWLCAGCHATAHREAKND